MYRQLNLRDSNGTPPSGLVGTPSDTGLATNTSEPANFPDEYSDGRWFIFVVGSNVGGQAARGWEAEVFKGLYWSHSHAKFVGVSWFGDPYDTSPLVYDYYGAVRNAFTTAPTLASIVNGNFTGLVTVAGHSLGCMLIASAINDSGMNANNACFVDAALARECFDGNVSDTGMNVSSWTGIDARLWASYWYQLFPSNDARSNLTWRSRFQGATPIVSNFYSSTEDVLAAYSSDPPSDLVSDLYTAGENLSFRPYAWVFQEKLKGQAQNYGIVNIGSNYCGWGFTQDDIGYWFYTAGSLALADQGMLDHAKTSPLFGDGNDINGTLIGPSWLPNLFNGTTGNSTAAVPAYRNQFLAEAIPALSLPAGANYVTNFQTTNNYNMPATFADHVGSTYYWPSELGIDETGDASNGLPYWHHSNMQEVAYPYLWQFYDQLENITKQ